MDTNHAVEALGALAHTGRLEIFRLLVRRAPEQVRAGELAAALGIRATTLSNQLSQLETAGLIRSRRDGRSILYAADMERAGGLLEFLIADCCRSRPEACAPATAAMLRQREATGARAVLFLCTANSARSLMAEAILSRLGGGQFQAFSAGADPREAPHPLALELLRAEGYDVSALQPKSWSAFTEADAPRLDFVFTVCDRAANEACPVWPGQPMSAHWSAPDPALAVGGETERRAVFRAVYDLLHARIAAFVALPHAKLDARALQRRLDEIGLAAPPRLEVG